MWYLLSRYIYTVVGIFFFTFATPLQAQSTDSLELIVHADLADENIDVAMARAVFTRKLTRWSNGTAIKVYVLADEHQLHRDFVKGKLGFFPYQLRQIWDRLVFSGVERAPELVGSIEEMYIAIKSTPGAIGYAPVVKMQGVHYVKLGE